MKKRILQFSIIALLLVVACAIPLRATDAASGWVASTNQYVYVPSGLGSVTISWDTSGCATAQVYVCMDNKNEILWAQNPDGSGVADWIVAGHDYVFKLYAGTDRTELIETVNVIGIGTNGGTVAARETEVIVASGQTFGSAEITFGTNGYATAEIYVKMDNNAEQLWGRNPNGTATATWIQADHKYQFNLYAGTGHSTLLDTVTVYGRKYTYDVGVNYHATGSSFDSTSFLRDYHVAAVRNTVLSQLQNMANAGAGVIHTHLWMVVTSGTPAEKWKWNFPPSAQQLTNLNTFAEDVADIQASDGHRLKMDICICLLWAADYQVGSPATTLGDEHLSVSNYNTRMVSTYQGIVNQVYNVYRPDGHKVIDRIYLTGEVMIGAKANEDWFLNTHYQNFVDYCNNRSVTPSLYFNACGTEAEVLDNNFTDGTYPAINGHRSMYWVYRSLYFLNNPGENLPALPIPDRIDFSTYVTPVNSTYAVMVRRVFDDAEASLPYEGCRKWFSAAETFYLSDNTAREALGAAFATERLRNDRVTLTSFWTTPDGGGWGVHQGYPFDIADYLP